VEGLGGGLIETPLRILLGKKKARHERPELNQKRYRLNQSDMPRSLTGSVLQVNKQRDTNSVTY
jgi:hypothetical protein